MKEAGCRYKAHKNSYYVDCLEDPDVVGARKTYLISFFDDVICEHCWMQLMKKKYLALKLCNAFQTIKIKNEKDYEGDMMSKINEYIDMHCTYFYTITVNEELVEMVEIHGNYLCSYCVMDNKRKLLEPGTLSGCTSVQLPVGKKTVLAFGQDEAIYRSLQLNESCWTVDGDHSSNERTWHRNNGVCFVSRATGFGINITAEQLVEINKTRADTQYTDKDVSNYLSRNADKNTLTESLFFLYLNYR